MEFIDFSPNKMDNLDWEDISNRNNSPIVPRSIRGLIVGKSGCGKTNLLLNLLLKPELLDYNKCLCMAKVYFNPSIKYYSVDLITI